MQGPPVVRAAALHDICFAANGSANGRMKMAAPSVFDATNAVAGSPSASASEHEGDLDLRLRASERQLETIHVLISDECRKLRELDARARDVVVSWRLVERLVRFLDVGAPTPSARGAAENSCRSGDDGSRSGAPTLRQTSKGRPTSNSIAVPREGAGARISVPHYTRLLLPLEGAMREQLLLPQPACEESASSLIADARLLAIPAQQPGNVALPFAKYVVRYPRAVLRIDDARDADDADAFQKEVASLQDQLSLLLELEREEAQAVLELRALLVELRTKASSCEEGRGSRDEVSNRDGSPSTREASVVIIATPRGTPRGVASADGGSLGSSPRPPEAQQQIRKPNEDSCCSSALNGSSIQEGELSVACDERCSEPSLPPESHTSPLKLECGPPHDRRGSSPGAALTADRCTSPMTPVEMQHESQQWSRSTSSESRTSSSGGGSGGGGGGGGSGSGRQGSSPTDGELRVAATAAAEFDRRLRDSTAALEAELAAARERSAELLEDCERHRCAASEARAALAAAAVAAVGEREAAARETTLLAAQLEVAFSAAQLLRSTMLEQQDTLRKLDVALVRARAAAAAEAAKASERGDAAAAASAAELRAVAEREALAARLEALTTQRERESREHSAQLAALAARLADRDAECATKDAEIDRLLIVADISSSVGAVPFHSASDEAMQQEVRGHHEWLWSQQEAVAHERTRWRPRCNAAPTSSGVSTRTTPPPRLHRSPRRSYAALAPDPPAGSCPRPKSNDTARDVADQCTHHQPPRRLAANLLDEDDVDGPSVPCTAPAPQPTPR